MVGVSTLETRLKAADADSSSFTDATRASDRALTAWSCTPLEFVRFSNEDIFFNDVIVLLDFSRAKLLDFFDRVNFFASLLHAS